MAVLRDGNWLAQVRSRLGHISIDVPSHTIFRVSHSLFDEESKILHHPSIVSIGPLHHGNPNVQSMEEHKMRYLLSLMRRNRNPEQLMDSCANAILRLDERIRACYAEKITLENTKLAEILLVDGCFLIELFIKEKEKSEGVVGDPLFDSAWVINALRRDLALLENQIPFFVLEELFDLTVRLDYENRLEALKTFILQLFRWELNLEDEEAFDLRCKDERKPDHLLDLIRDCYITKLEPESMNSCPRIYKKSYQHDWKSIRSAKALSEAGIRFEKNPSENLLDLEFGNKDGKFKIPQLVIHGWTESLFRNLMAFEQCRYDHHKSYITSYIILMDRLIDSTQDVVFLEKKKILKGYMGDVDAVARLFNNTGKQGVLMDFHFGQLCGDLEKYYKRWWPKHRASFWRDYFPDAWRGTAIVVAGLILVFTTVQVVYAVLSYY